MEKTLRRENRIYQTELASSIWKNEIYLKSKMSDLKKLQDEIHILEELIRGQKDSLAFLKEEI